MKTSDSIRGFLNRHQHFYTDLVSGSCRCPRSGIQLNTCSVMVDALPVHAREHTVESELTAPAFCGWFEGASHATRPPSAMQEVSLAFFPVMLGPSDLSETDQREFFKLTSCCMEAKRPVLFLTTVSIDADFETLELIL